MSVLELLRVVPFLRFAFALGTGIYIADYLIGEISIRLVLIISGVVFAGLVIIVFVPVFYQKYQFRWLTGILSFLFFFHTGVILAFLSVPSQFNGECRVEGVGKVIEADITHSGYHRYTVVPLWVKSSDSVRLRRTDRWQMVVEPKDSLVALPAKPGHRVFFKTTISGYQSASNPCSFDYGRYLYRHGISGSGFVSHEDFRVLSFDGLDGIAGWIKEARERTRQIYIDNGIGGEKLQVLSALTLGMRQGLSDEVKSRFVHSGAIHLLAVSGLHVGIVFLFLNFFLNIFLPVRSFVRMLIIVFGLAFYAVLTGGAPSVFRAVVMLSVIQIGYYYNQNGNIYNLLGVSAVIIFMIQPMSLFYAGFWLSHFAVAGIVTFYPIFRRFYAGGNIFIRSIGDLAGVSLSAQIGAFPLSLFLFRAFPVWFLLTNFLILPLVAPVLIMANFLIIFNEIPFLAAAIAGFLNDFIGFMLEMVAWIDALPGGYIQGLWMGTLTMILIYFTLTTCLIWRESKSRLFFKMFALALMCLMAVFNYEYWEKRNTDVLVVFDVGRSNAIGIVNSGQGLLLSDSTASERQLSFASSGFFAKHAFNVEQKHLFSGGNVDCQSLICTVGDARFLGIGDVDLDLFETENEELSGISGVLFLGDIKGDVIGFLESLGCPDVVVAKTCPPWCVGKWKNDIEKLDIRTHFIAEGGAFLKFY